MASRWTALAALAALGALPAAYLAWERAARRSERQQALKLLRKVELIAAEVAVRLQHLAKQAEEAATGDAEDDGATDAGDASASTLNSYYHFDSQGNKLKTKWDSYDVDAELRRLEEEEEEEETGEQQREASAVAAAAGSTARVERKPQRVAIDKKKLANSLGGIEREFEAVLAFLDDIRGDEHVKQLRKAIALKINEEHFGRIDDVRRILAA